MANDSLNIIVIMLYWYPYEGPLMPIYASIFKDLVDKGHKVTIITSFPHYRKGRKETWSEYRGKLYEVTEWESIRIIRTYVIAPVFKNEKLGMICRSLNFISFNISSSIFSILVGGSADIIFAPSSPPLTNGFVAWIVGLIKQCPTIYNVQDLYPDMAVKVNLVKNRLLVKLLKLAEKTVYKMSDMILTISTSMADIIQRKNIPSSKIEIIRNFIDTDFLIPASKNNTFAKKNNLQNYFVVMYAGNIGIPHGVEILIDSAEFLKEESDILFCFVARGENREKVERKAKEKNLPNTLFIEQQPEKTVPLIWASASICIITYRKGLAGYSVPSKLLTMMCAARPVIAAVDKNSEPAKIIEASGCGWVVPPENSKALSDALLMLKSKPELLKNMGRAGRNYVEKNLQRRAISKQYEILFQLLRNNYKFSK
jgi:putative colanic acid biosynthesis glycosyltransferase WcaI